MIKGENVSRTVGGCHSNGSQGEEAGAGGEHPLSGCALFFLGIFLSLPKFCRQTNVIYTTQHCKCQTPSCKIRLDLRCTLCQNNGVS